MKKLSIDVDRAVNGYTVLLWAQGKDRCELLIATDTTELVALVAPRVEQWLREEH